MSLTEVGPTIEAVLKDLEPEGIDSYVVADVDNNNPFGYVLYGPFDGYTEAFEWGKSHSEGHFTVIPLWQP